jgi:hypothetical protein
MALRVQLAKLHNMVLDARCQRQVDGIGRDGAQIVSRTTVRQAGYCSQCSASWND